MDDKNETSHEEKLEKEVLVESPEATATKETPVVNTAKNKPTSKWYMQRRNQVLLGGVLIVLLVASLFVAFRSGGSSDNVADDTDQSQQDRQTLEASLTLIEGTVEVGSSEEFQAATSGAALKTGQHVRTGADSRAVITLGDGSLVRMNELSELQLTSLDTDTIVITNLSGEVYSRVAKSDSRSFEVFVGDNVYIATGTAYKTTNTPDDEGVDVYEGDVKNGDDVEIGEGESFFTKTKDGSDANKVIKIDQDSLKDDDFVQWNKQEDMKKFSNNLGVLNDDKKDSDDDEDDSDDSDSTPPEDDNEAANIGVSASPVDNGIKIIWEASGLGDIAGFKINYSSSNTSPTYGIDSSKFVSADTSSKVIEKQDGEKWYFRVCAYRDGGSCTNYSSAVSATAPTAPVTPENIEIAGSKTIACDSSMTLYTWAETSYYSEPNGAVQGTKPSGKTLNGTCATTEGWYKYNGLYLLGTDLYDTEKV